MSEKHNILNNALEQQASENDFVKMASEAPSFEEHMKQYEAEHPDAVTDIDKARAMAEAGDRVRNEAMLRNNLELAIQNGDSKKENEILNQLASLGVEDMMDSLKYYPDGTAFQRTQKSLLSALYKTGIGRKINYLTERHNFKYEARKWDQSEWAQSLLESAARIEENMKQNTNDD